MLPGYKRVANIAAGVGFGSIAGALLVFFYVPDLLGVWIGKVPLATVLLVILGDVLFVPACWCYAKSKGHRGAWGLIVPLGFALITAGWFDMGVTPRLLGWTGGTVTVVGLLVLAFLPDEHRWGK